MSTGFKLGHEFSGPKNYMRQGFFCRNMMYKKTDFNKQSYSKGDHVTTALTLARDGTQLTMKYPFLACMLLLAEEYTFTLQIWVSQTNSSPEKLIPWKSIIVVIFIRH